MIEILNTFTVNHKITELLNEEHVILADKSALEKYRKELKKQHDKEIIFTYREKP